MKIHFRSPRKSPTAPSFGSIPLWTGTALFVFSSAPAGASFEDFQWLPRSVGVRELRLNPQADYRFSRQNFNESGQAVAVTDLNDVTRVGSQVWASYGLNSSLSLYGKLGWSHFQVDHTTLNLSGSIFGFSEQTLGVNYRIPLEKASLTRSFAQTAIEIQLQADVPAYSNTTSVNAGIPFLGDGSSDLTGGVFFRMPFGSNQSDFWTLDLGTGLSWRSNGFSMGVPALIQVERISEQSGWVGKASVQGNFALGTDSNSLPTSQNGAGGSYMVNAVNPTRIQAEAQLGYRFGPAVAVQLFGRAPVWGIQSAQTWTAGLNFEANFGRHTGPRRPENQSPSEYGKGNQGFVPYTLEGKVLKTNDRLNLVKIDKGLQDGVTKGQVFDIFTVRDGGQAGETIARGQVTSALDDQAVLTVIEYFREIWIEEGFIVKKPLQ